MLKKQIQNLPESPGVYLFKDEHNHIIYIGKAKNLKKRVSSYFKPTHDWKIETIINSATSINHIGTKSELDALLLEATLIQQHQPKFNVLLKNGQPYIYILVTKPKTIQKSPSTNLGRTNVLHELKLVRNKKEQGAYFGPFIEKTVARNVYNFLVKTFKLKLCNKKIKSGCLYYHIGLCAGTCRDDFDKDAYLQRLKLATQVLLQRKPVRPSIRSSSLKASKNTRDEKFLPFALSLSKGFNERQSQNQTSILQDLKDKIKIHNQKLEFEKSKELQKYIESFETAFAYLNTDFSKKEHLFQYKHVWIGINDSLFLFSEKNGIVRKKQVFSPFALRDFEQSQEIVSKGFTERVTEYIESFYREHEPPQTILMNFELKNKKLFEEFLQTWHKKTYPVQIIQPTSGQLLNIMHLAQQEAQQNIEKNASLSKYLKKLLKLSFEPRTIDCFDISQMQGESMVGACVRFVDGKPDKKMFRHFIIKTVHTQDDYASLREIVERRYRVFIPSDFERKRKIVSRDVPDLILIDGGKGQLNAVKNLVPEVAFASLAKKEETLFSKNLPDGKVLNIKNIADQTLIALRDYTHHFAISFHRQREKL